MFLYYHGQRVELAAVSDASSGHLRRCSDAHTINQCLSREKDASILSWPESRAGGRLSCLIRSPTMLSRCRYTYNELA
eukprot:scaffold31550_cov105-Skeletonema_dohrnii-CCMP3373.AAC.1